MKHLLILLVFISFNAFAGNDYEYSQYHGIKISPTQANNIRLHREQQIRREIQNERIRSQNHSGIRPRMDPGGSYIERRRWADHLEGR